MKRSYNSIADPIPDLEMDVGPVPAPDIRPIESNCCNDLLTASGSSSAFLRKPPDVPSSGFSSTCTRNGCLNGLGIVVLLLFLLGTICTQTLPPSRVDPLHCIDYCRANKVTHKVDCVKSCYDDDANPYTIMLNVTDDVVPKPTWKPHKGKPS